MVVPGWAVTLVIALLFYVAIPGAGAFVVRSRWRRFRSAVLAARDAPALDYAEAHGGAPHSQERWVHFFGRLEAIQRDRSIWIGSGRLSAKVDLSRVAVYVLPAAGIDRDALPDETPRQVYWKNLSAMAEGTRVFVAGPVRRAAGEIRFIGERRDEPLVIVYDCPDSEVFANAVWAGRQRNEYWNYLTPISLIAGFVAETFWAVTLISDSRLQTLVALVAALVPVLPFFPPGVIGFYWYRRLWRAARRLRARRDLARVQGAELDASADYAPDRMSGQAWRREAVAVALVMGGILVNAYAVTIAAALFLQ
jgi:hypothetical protein